MLASSHDVNAQRQYLKYQLVCLRRAISKHLAVKKKKKKLLLKACEQLAVDAELAAAGSELYDKNSSPEDFSICSTNVLEWQGRNHVSLH